MEGKMGENMKNNMHIQVFILVFNMYVYLSTYIYIYMNLVHTWCLQKLKVDIWRLEQDFQMIVCHDVGSGNQIHDLYNKCP